MQSYLKPSFVKEDERRGIHEVHNWSLKCSNTGWMLLKTLLYSVICFNTLQNCKGAYTSREFDV